ncbi:hypothetical protein GCM10020331_055740 [Ectobacillus funiculus]
MFDIMFSIIEEGQDMNHHQTELKKELKVRHITMISLGGIIGAGLFVGSGSLINMAGPASIFSYALAGLLVVFGHAHAGGNVNDQSI